MGDDKGLYLIPPLRNLKAGHWGPTTIRTFTRVPGEGIVRVPQVRLFIGRTWQPKQATFTLDEGRTHHFKLRSGAVTLIPAGALVRGTTEEVEAIHILHQPSVYRQAEEEIGARAAIDFVPDLGDPGIAQFAEMLAHEVESSGFGGRILVEALSYAIAIRVLRCLIGVVGDTRPFALSSERMRRVAEFIDAHLSDSELSLHELASVACLGAHQFGRAFKQATGSTPHQFVLERRIDRAKQLLREGALTLSEIAQVSGFVDQAHFGNRFRKIVGVTPRQYRLSLG